MAIGNELNEIQETRRTSLEVQKELTVMAIERRVVVPKNFGIRIAFLAHQAEQVRT